MGSPISEDDRQTSYLEDEDNSSLEFRCIGADMDSQVLYQLGNPRLESNMDIYEISRIYQGCPGY